MQSLRARVQYDWCWALHRKHSHMLVCWKNTNTADSYGDSNADDASRDERERATDPGPLPDAGDATGAGGDDAGFMPAIDAPPILPGVRP